MYMNVSYLHTLLWFKYGCAQRTLKHLKPIFNHMIGHFHSLFPAAKSAPTSLDGDDVTA
jgi:hypothetical protein